MATVKGFIDASPSAVFAVLADGWLYSNWVVGTSHVRAVETAWPEPDSKVFHASGMWPAVIRDETQVQHMEAGRRLVVIARGWPMGEALVSIDLTTVPQGTEVTLTETPTGGPGKWLHNPAADALLTRRNTESLARLKAMVERHTAPSK